ncbi:hypothetical protein BKA93DRAFT_795545 [Sparassis latifolia]
MERKSLGRNDMQGRMLPEAVYDPLCPSIRACRSWPFSGEFLVGTRLQGLAERQSVARARPSAESPRPSRPNLSLPESTVHDIWGRMPSEAFDACASVSAVWGFRRGSWWRRGVSDKWVTGSASKGCAQKHCMVQSVLGQSQRIGEACWIGEPGSQSWKMGCRVRAVLAEAHPCMHERVSIGEGPPRIH